MQTKKIYGIIATVIGVIGEAYALVTINADKTGNFWGGYTYEPPFSSHEITYISIAVISALVIIAGLIMVLKGKSEKQLLFPNHNTKEKTPEAKLQVFLYVNYLISDDNRRGTRPFFSLQL